MSPRLIVNADDFGRSGAINRAIIRAHVEGILTSASLMVGGDAADEAIELAKQHPTLAVGLHVVVVDGPAVLPPARIGHLADANGSFPDAPVRLGLRYAFSNVARAQLKDELVAQFDRYASTGLKLSHVDGHQHMHMHPAVFEMILPLAEQYGAAGIRLVRDDLWLALRHDASRLLAKLCVGSIFAVLSPRCRRLCRDLGFAVPQQTYGFLQSGAMTESYLLEVINCLSHDSAEIYFHPTEGGVFERLGPNSGDLQTLLSPAVRNAIRARQLQLSTYQDLLLDAHQKAAMHLSRYAPSGVDNSIAPVIAR